MEAGVVRVTVLLCLALVVAPAAAASPEDGIPEVPVGDSLLSQSEADADDAGQDDAGKKEGSKSDKEGSKSTKDTKSEKKESKSGEGEAPEEESIDLVVNPDDAGNRLNWSFHGTSDHVESFDVYRSVNEGAAQLIGSLSKYDQTFVDSRLEETGAYSYFVTATHRDGNQTKSNIQIVGVVLLTCDWVTVSPFGKPPVLVNPECFN